MIKFLIKLGSFLVCVGILAFGGYQTVEGIKINEMIGEIETALENAPNLPDFGGSEDGNGGEGQQPGGEVGGGSSQIPGGDNNQGGGSQPGGNPDQGDNNQGGNDQPGGDNNQGGNDQPGGDNNQGGGSQPGGDNTQGGGSQPGGDGDNTEPNPPQNDTLSSESAQEALGQIYDNSDPEFNDLGREFFVGMVEGFISGSGSSEPDPEPQPPVEDPGEEEEEDFGAEFNPDEYNPDDEEPEDAGQNEVNDLIVDVAGTYFDNLQAGIQQNQQDNAGGTEEEQQAARDQFIQRESEAFAGLINIATKPEETTDDQLVQSVDAVLNSNVCLDTVTQSVEKNDSLSTTVQDATANLNEETKAEIETKINEALEANPEKEQQYKDLANLFGITLGAEGTPVIPDGVNPDDYPF